MQENKRVPFVSVYSVLIRLIICTTQTQLHLYKVQSNCQVVCPMQRYVKIT